MMSNPSFPRFPATNWPEGSMLVPRSQQKSVTEVRILEAAVQLFAHHGFSGTSTREIAQLADVNETTLFRYYGTKKDLFWAALEARLSRIKLSRELQSALSSDHEPGEVLPKLFDFVVELICGQPELMRLLYVSALELPGSDEIYRKHLGAIFDSITAYLTRSTTRGAISGIDPHLATLAFVGTVISHSSLYQLFVGRALPYSTTSEASSAYSNFWLSMLRGVLEPPPLVADPGSLVG
jgi:AcrR family transcriptional regulator